MKSSSKAVALTCMALTLALLASCGTMNRLGSYRIENSSLAVDMRAPPTPTFDVDFSVTIDPRNPVITAISIGTNLAKADRAAEAEGRMRRALEMVDVPAVFLREVTSSCVKALDAELVESKFQADYLLDLDIRSYGVDADSPGAAVCLRMAVAAAIFDNASGERLWRKSFNVREKASPVVFGLGNVAGSFLNTAAIANLGMERMEEGFERLARESARKIARALENDLYEARYE